MDRGRSLFIFKVKCQISRSLGLYKEFWHLDPCGQDKARTIWPRMLILSVYTLYGQRKKPIYFQGQMSNFKVTRPLQRILALDPCGQDIARTLSTYIFKIKGQIPRSVDLYKDSGTWICVGRIEQELCSLCAET